MSSSKRFMGAALAGALMFSSTASSAAVRGPTSWQALTMMSGASAAATMCGSSAIVAGAAAAVAPGGCVLPQVDAAAPAAPAAQSAPPRPIPVPPVEAPASLYFDPLLIGLGAVAIGALVYFLVIKKGGDSPDSPA